MIQLKLKHAWPSTPSNPLYDCTLKEWDLGVSIGSGKTIQEAIEAFFEWEYDMKNEDRPVNYKWS